MSVGLWGDFVHRKWGYSWGFETLKDGFHQMLRKVTLIPQTLIKTRELLNAFWQTRAELAYPKS